MDNKINFFILFIGTWILFSIALIANNKYFIENIINIFIFINISLLLISIISSIQRNKDNQFQKKEKEFIDYIYKKENNIINEKINELLNLNININRKKLLIKIEDKLIQMKEKELKNIMMNNLKKNNNITREELKIIIINQKQMLEDYKYELKATIILLDLKK